MNNAETRSPWGSDNIAVHLFSLRQMCWALTFGYTPVITTAPPPTGWAGDNGANVRGSDLSNSPAVPGKCWACDISQIYPHGIYYDKEQGCDSQQVPAVQGF